MGEAWSQNILYGRLIGKSIVKDLLERERGRVTPRWPPVTAGEPQRDAEGFSNEGFRKGKLR